MFLPVKSDTGAAIPWEYIPAKAGDYQPGQLLDTTGGMVTAIAAAQAAQPPYLCMGKVTVGADGDILPVTRIQHNYIYEATLGADAGNLAVGDKLGISAGGLDLDPSAAGVFEVVGVDETTKGSVVRGRWTGGNE